MSQPILTARVGTSADIFPGILKLYAREGALIADVTYGRGVFWQQVDKSKYSLTTSDIQPNSACGAKADCRDLWHLGDGTVDVLVLDPPFMAGVAVRGQLNSQYKVNELNLRYPGVMQLYQDSITEAKRVLKVGGRLIVKCQDIVESGTRHFAHLEILQMAENLGFYPLDLFVLVNPRAPMMRHDHQQHARANHSYFWVLEKQKG